MSEETKVNPYEDKYKDYTIAELAAAMKDVKADYEDKKAIAGKAYAEFDALRLHIVPKLMEEMDISSVKIEGVGRLGVTTDLYAGIVTDHKGEAYQWLYDNGHGDLIKGTVNSSTLKAFLKEQIKQGEEFPEELFKVTPYDRASLTKA